MYKDNFEFEYIKLYKEDFLELDHIIKEQFKEEDISIFFDTKNSKKEYKSFDEFYETNKQILNTLEKDIENISIRIINNTQRFMGKCVNIYISSLNVRISIEAIDDEIWVNGISQLFKNYFQKKSSPILKLYRVVPLVAGACIGGGSTFFLLESSILIKILLLFIFVIGIILANRKLVMKVLPIVKISLGKKEKLNISEIFTVLGVGISLLSLIVTIIFNII